MEAMFHGIEIVEFILHTFDMCSVRCALNNVHVLSTHIHLLFFLALAYATKMQCMCVCVCEC